MGNYIIYFTIHAKGGNGGQKVSPVTSCVCNDCYLCPLQGCARINGDIRAKATPAALSWLRKKRPKSIIVKKLMTEEEARKKWQS